VLIANYHALNSESFVLIIDSLQDIAITRSGAWFNYCFGPFWKHFPRIPEGYSK